MIDEAMIERLVHRFYSDIRRDAVLGPIFDRAIGDRWDAHLAKLCDFWSSVLLRTGRFQGSPLRTHVRLPDLEPAHFERWLTLFREAARATFPPEAAEYVITKAEMIGASLQMGLTISRGGSVLAT
jgi:hemoglobin